MFNISDEYEVLIATKNYGITGSEYRAKWSESPLSYALSHESFIVLVPYETFKVYENTYGDTLIEPYNSGVYFINEIMYECSDDPNEFALMQWYDNYGEFNRIHVPIRKVN